MSKSKSKTKVEDAIEKEVEVWMKKPFKELIKFNMRAFTESDKVTVFDLAVAHRVVKLMGLDINEMAKEQTIKTKGGLN